MSDAELQQLGEDIKNNGLQMPLALLRDGSLIDGRNRLDAMERAGLRIFDPLGDLALPHTTADIDDPHLYVVSANFHRRHLMPKQRDELVRKLKAERPELSIRAISAATHTSKSKVGRALKRSVVPSGTPEPVTGLHGKRYPPKSKSTPKPKVLPAQERDRAIVDFSKLLRKKPLNTLEDLNKILEDTRSQIVTLSFDHRRALARNYLIILDVSLNDLRQDANTTYSMRTNS